MDSIDVELIINDIKEKINKNKRNYENLLNFITTELSKSKITLNDEILETITENIKSKYSTKEETKELLNKKFETAKEQLSLKMQIQEQNLPYNLNRTRVTSPTFNFTNKNTIKALEQNKDLSDTSDEILHFSKHHLSFVSRIFYLQVTQNYLKALKWYFTNELIEKQTKFNTAASNELQNILNKIQVYERKNEIIFTELKNGEKKFEKITHDLEIKINENKNELKDLLTNKNLETIEFLLSKIAKLDDKINSIIDEKKNENNTQ